MRTVLALALLLAFSPHAGALTIKPDVGKIVPSPDGRLVFVLVAPWSGIGTDPDAETIRAICRKSGLYRRGDWAEPLWELSPSAAWGELFTANNGVHFAVHDGEHYARATSPDLLDMSHPDATVSRRRRILDVPAFTLYESGTPVRTVYVSEMTGSAQGALDRGVIRTAEFDAEGLFRVTSGDGNLTVWNPVTGKRVEGRGAVAEMGQFVLVGPMVVVTVCLVGLAALKFFERRARRRTPA